MLTPLDIAAKGTVIKELRKKTDDLSPLLAQARWESLMVLVLEEIASKSLDPRTLAIEALKYQKEK